MSPREKQCRPIKKLQTLHIFHNYSILVQIQNSLENQLFALCIMYNSTYSKRCNNIFIYIFHKYISQISYHWIWRIITVRFINDGSFVRTLNLHDILLYIIWLSWPDSLEMGGVRICFIVSMYHPRPNPITDSDLTPTYVHEYDMIYTFTVSFFNTVFLYSCRQLHRATSLWHYYLV